jgi:tetratricopeptide (TPR) repeat protein
MSSYPFSSKSVTCDPAVDHAAAGRAAFAAGDYAGALPHFFCAFSANPIDLDLHVLNFEAMLRCGLHSTSTLSEAVLDTLGNDRWEVMAQAAQASLAANPLDEGAAILLTRVTYFVSPPSERAALIGRLQSINPQSTYALLLLAQDAATLHKDATTANRLLATATTLAANDPEILSWIADLYSGGLEVLKDLPRALALYNEALMLNRELALNYAGRGVAQQELGDFEGARADMDYALQLTPFDYRLYNFRARLFQAQGDDAAALADYRHVLVLNPASYWALKGVCELGVKMNSLQDRQAAAQAFASSHILKPAEGFLSPDAPVRVRLAGMNAATVKARLAEGQEATFTITGGDSVFPAALLVAPDGGAVLFAHRTFESGASLKLPMVATVGGEYTLMVIFNGPGEQQLSVRME